MSEPSTRPSGEADPIELVQRAARRFRRLAAGRFETLGLTGGQARALRTIARAGEPVRMGDLAHRLDVVPRSATSVVDELETAQLVERVADPNDRRVTLVRLTPEGARRLEALREQRRAAAAPLLDRLTDADRLELTRLLTLLTDDGAAGLA